MAVQLDPSSSRSFTPLSTLSLSGPHVLHSASCNPAMDLVVLLAPAQPAQSASAALKGKGKATDMSAWRGTKVVLWRMLGSKVWEVEVRGWVAGLAWSGDGLYLSLLLLMPAARRAVLEHRSVHNGEVVKIVPIDLPDAAWEAGPTEVQLEWRDSSLEWETARDGSARQIIASLPTVTPVEPPKPAVVNPFAKPIAAANTKLPHPALSTFPCLLSSTPSLPPHTLQVSLPGRDLHLLTGSFPCPSSSSSSHLRLAQSADSLASFLNIVLRGLEAIEAAWRDGYKQTMLWREELEECGKLQGMPVRDVHADLFRLLMTGRCREAISEWLGNKLTGRMLTKWEQTLATSLQTIQKIVAESVSPALERVMILLQGMRGWERSQYHSAGLSLRSEDIEQSIDITGGMIKLIERIRQDAELETLAAAAWMAWLKFETAQAGSGGGDDPPTATHDLKLTWSFLVNGFVRSIFSSYFPDDTPTRPPSDALPPAYVQSLSLQPPSRSLDDVLSHTLSRLSGKPTRTSFKSPVVEQDEAMSMDQSSMLLSSPAADSRIIEESGVDLDIESEGPDEDEVLTSDTETDGDGESAKHKGKKGEAEEEAKVQRVLEMEPWAWANSLIATTEGMIRAAVGEEAGGVVDQGYGWTEGIMTTRTVGEVVWGAHVAEAGRTVILVSQHGLESRALRIILGDGTACLALQFFDDIELAMLLETASGRFHATTAFASYLDHTLPISTAIGSVGDLVTLAMPEVPLVIHRSRYLTSEGGEGPVALALNGKKGRRVGCVMNGQEGEVEVWDMEDDEGDEEEEGDGDDEEQEEEEMRDAS